jgi:hypothetical protein
LTVFVLKKIVCVWLANERLALFDCIYVHQLQGGCI